MNSSASSISDGPVFQAGGTLKEGALYVERLADGELPDRLRQGQLCYVLAPRQIGKSSLRERTAQRLSREGLVCVSIDLTAIGGQTTVAAAWYYALLGEIADKLRDWNLDPSASWEATGETTHSQHLIRFLRDELLAKVPGQVIIFVDEIDAVRALPFPCDEFFAAVRAIANNAEPIFKRLTFCLLGVAQPGDLIQREDITPFNIGHSVTLADFTRAEAEAFRPGLAAAGDGRALLDAIYDRTSGHPYMIQRIAEALVAQPESKAASTSERVAALVQELFLARSQALDTNLAYAAKKFDRVQRTPRTAQMLDTYARLLSGEVVLAQGKDPAQGDLLLAGMVAVRSHPDGLRIEVRNFIFSTFFNEEWLKEQQKDRRFADSLRLWMDSGRSDNAVLRGNSLSEAQEWAETQADLTVQERQFLRASERVSTEEEAKAARRSREKAQTQAQAQVRMRTIWLLTLTVVILSAMLVIAYTQYRKAKNERNRAELATLIERGSRALFLSQQPFASLEALTLGLQSLPPQVPERGARIGTAAHPADVPPRVFEGLAAAATHGGYPIFRPTPLGATDYTMGQGGLVRFSPDGSRLLSASNDGTARIWDARNGVPLFTLSGLTKTVIDANFSPDGSKLATASVDGTVRLWDTKSGTPLFTLNGHTQIVRAVSFSPDGSKVVTASYDGTARLWDTTRAVSVLTFSGHTQKVIDASFSPDGSKVVTASYDGTARLWDTNSGASLFPFIGHAQKVVAASFSPDGSKVVTASDDGTARLWDANSGASLFTLSGHTKFVSTARFSPDSSQVVTASDDGTARLWDANSGVSLFTLSGHTKFVSTARFSPDSSKVVTASDDGTARLWDTKRGAFLFLLRGHIAPVQDAQFSPDGSRVVTAGEDGTARLWDANNEDSLFTLKGHISLKSHNTLRILASHFSPDGSKVVTAGEDATARLWDANSGAPLVTLRGHLNWLNDAQFSPDGRRIVTASEDPTARLWDANSGASLVTLVGHTSRVRVASFSPDGRRVLTASDDDTARLWDADSGTSLYTLDGHHSWENFGLIAASFSPDGSKIVTASYDGTARLWDAKSGASLLTLGDNTSGVIAGFSPDGSKIVTASYDGTARLWDAKNGARLVILKGHTNAVQAVSFSPDGSKIVTASYDGTARLWDAKNGTCLFILKGHTNTVRAARFSPDGSKVVTASDDGTAILSDVKTGSTMAKLVGHRGPLKAAAFSPDGSKVVMVSDDGSAIIYSTQIEHYARRACNILVGHPDEFRTVAFICQRYLSAP